MVKNDCHTILYVGPLFYGSTCLQRLNALKELGFRVTALDTEPPDVQQKQKGVLYRVIRKFFGPADLAGVNGKIIDTLEKETFDIIWLDKALTVWPSTLQKIRRQNPKVTIVGYSPDDMTGNRNNQSRHFLKSLPLYDVYFTTKSYGVVELKSLGCRRATFIGNAYDPDIHKPMGITDEDRLKFGGAVGFIGDYEKERAGRMFFLAENGIPVRIWGADWKRKCKFSHPNLKLEEKPLWGSDYAKAINSFDIVLCFLRKVNRDLQTQRSVEIPACGAFMLAEETDEHLKLFNKGTEAEYFHDAVELLEKVKYYISHPVDRKRIAAAGRERCLEEGYSYKDRIIKMLDVIRDIRNEKDQ